MAKWAHLWVAGPDSKLHCIIKTFVFDQYFLSCGMRVTPSDNFQVFEGLPAMSKALHNLHERYHEIWPG